MTVQKPRYFGDGTVLKRTNPDGRSAQLSRGRDRHDDTLFAIVFRRSDSTKIAEAIAEGALAATLHTGEVQSSSPVHSCPYVLSTTPLPASSCSEATLMNLCTSIAEPFWGPPSDKHVCRLVTGSDRGLK